MANEVTDAVDAVSKLGPLGGLFAGIGAAVVIILSGVRVLLRGSDSAEIRELREEVGLLREEAKHGAIMSRLQNLDDGQAYTHKLLEDIRNEVVGAKSTPRARG